MRNHIRHTSAILAAIFYLAATASAAVNGNALSIASTTETMLNVTVAHSPALIATGPKTHVTKQNISAPELPVEIFASPDMSASVGGRAGTLTRYHSPLIYTSLSERAPPER